MTTKTNGVAKNPTSATEEKAPALIVPVNGKEEAPAPDAEKKEPFWPLAYLFSNLQVEQL